MAGEMVLIGGIGTLISFVILLIFAISAFLRYLKKRTRLAKVIFYAFFAYAISMAFGLVSTVIQVQAIDLGDFGLVAYVPFFWLVIGSYYLFIFSQIVFLGEHKHTLLEVVAVIGTAGCIIFGVLRYYVPTQPITVGRVVWILAFTGIIAIPILSGALHLRRRLPADDPHRTNLLYIAALAVAFLLMIVFFLLDTILIMFLSWENPTIAFLLAEICVILMVYCAQRGFFSTSKPG
jgi:hypothetical protein